MHTRCVYLNFETGVQEQNNHNNNPNNCIWRCNFGSLSESRFLDDVTVSQRSLRPCCAVRVVRLMRYLKMKLLPSLPPPSRVCECLYG